MTQPNTEIPSTRSSSQYSENQYPLSSVTGNIIAAAQEVFHVLGPGFMEVIYQRALAKELPTHNLEFSREVDINVMYKGTKVGTKRVDFIIGNHEGEVMVEIKAKATLEDVDYIQALSYLKASGYCVGLLINFGGRKLEIRRLINQESARSLNR